MSTQLKGKITGIADFSNTAFFESIKQGYIIYYSTDNQLVVVSSTSFSLLYTITVEESGNYAVFGNSLFFEDSSCLKRVDLKTGEASVILEKTTFNRLIPISDSFTIGVDFNEINQEYETALIENKSQLILWTITDLCAFVLADKDVLLFSSSDHLLLKRKDFLTGKDMWVHALKNNPISYKRSLYKSGNIVFCIDDGLIKGISTIDGALTWSSKSDATIWHESSDGCFYSLTDSISKLDPASGIIEIISSTSSVFASYEWKPSSNGIMVSSNRIFFTINHDGITIGCFDILMKCTQTIFETSSSTHAKGHAPFLFNNQLFLLTTEGELWIIDLHLTS